MTFTSSAFLPFLALTFLCWLPAGRTGRKLVLIAGSLLFYGAWDLRFLALLAAVWLVVFTVPQAMSRRAGPLSTQPTRTPGRLRSVMATGSVL